MSDHGSGDGLHNTHSLGVPVILSPGEHSQLAHGSIEKPSQSPFLCPNILSAGYL